MEDEMEDEMKDDGAQASSAVLAVAGGISALLCIIAGVDMMMIQSAAGDTIMEAYYHAMGCFAIGFGIFAGGLLFGIAGMFE